MTQKVQLCLPHHLYSVIALPRQWNYSKRQKVSHVSLTVASTSGVVVLNVL